MYSTLGAGAAEIQDQQSRAQFNKATILSLGGKAVAAGEGLP